MKCPACNEPLTVTRYEGVKVHACDSCGGHLVPRDRLSRIKHQQVESTEDLEQEAARKQPDSGAKIRCPRCNDKMSKKEVRHPFVFNTDTCSMCNLVWFDGGELALLQLAYEDSAQGKNATEMKRRFDQMSPERRKELQANLARTRFNEVAYSYWPEGSSGG